MIVHSLYNFFTRLACVGMPLAGYWNHKIAKGVQGRANWRQQYAALFPRHQSQTLWMHVSSLGEFEQGRPVIEAFKMAYPDWKVVLTFFSPSGYEPRKKYPYADFVAYLPLDTPANARDFIALVRPDLVIFVKYDLWANYLTEIKNRKIPLLLISALFREKQPFFKWYGGFSRKMLFAFDHIFVQTERDQQLLQQIDYQNTTVGKDTRIDRVIQLAAGAPMNATVAAFGAGHPVIVMGSSWEKDENLMVEALTHRVLSGLKVICAPHEPTPTHIQRLVNILGEKAILYSAASQSPTIDFEKVQWLIIDNIGLLNTLYQYGDLAYIGGGFGAGIHNTLEPAAYKLPIIFGPKYQKFEEARQLVARAGAYSVHTAPELANAIKHLLTPPFRQKSENAVQEYLMEYQGATAIIMSYIRTIVLTA